MKQAKHYGYDKLLNFRATSATTSMLHQFRWTFEPPPYQHQRVALLIRLVLLPLHGIVDRFRKGRNAGAHYILDQQHNMFPSHSLGKTSPTKPLLHDSGARLPSGII